MMPPSRPIAALRALLPGLLVLALLAAPGLARAQSYLSELPQGPATPPAAVAPAAAGTVAPEADLMHVPLDTLFAMVSQGRGHEAYPALKARFDDEMVQAARTPGTDPNQLRKTYLINLLRAGEGLATPADQEQTARAFTDYYPDDDQFPLAFFYLNEALFQQGKPLEQSFFFDQQAMASLPGWVQTRFLRMLAENAARQGHYADAASYLVTEQQSYTGLRQTTQPEIEDMLERMDDPDALMTFLQQHDSTPWLVQREPFLMAKVLLNGGQLDQALLKLDAILAQGQATSAADLKFVNDLKQEIRARVATRPDRIGVLLPLGSSASVLRELALETLDGLRMAVQFPDTQGSLTARLSRVLGQDLQTIRTAGKAGPPVPQRRYELVIRDTANSPQRAAKEVASLVQDDHVIAIIGPIARAESAAAAAKAEELGVPLISLSLSLDIPPGSKFVFRHSKSQEEEVRDLVRYSVDYLHDRRFAILYPDTAYGHTMSTLFWQQVEQRGGKVVAVAPFEPSARVTRQSRDAVGLKEIFARFTGLDRYQSPEDQALLSTVGDSHPDPIVDFDALYIPVGPDGIQDLQLIAPYPVTVDAEHVQLLGSRFWNDSSVLVAGDGKLDGAVFVDAFDLTSANPKVEAFHARHRMFFGHHAQYRPPTYYTGLGYDTANLLMSLLNNSHNHSRKALRDALVSMDPFFGVTGWTRFKENGEAEKESMFFRINGNEIQRLLP
ncbi:MAG TPA: penicillin-binding protein activator [bacterium]|nr:penicillin-binding protein activator [bacterium]